MSKEGLPLQFDLFSGELVDTRSDAQKKKDRERDTPQQMQMFKTPEMVQFGGKTKSAYRDWLDQSSAPPLMLEMIETRTPEEIERAIRREIEAQTHRLFSDHPELYEQSVDTEPMNADEDELEDIPATSNVYERKPETSKEAIYFDLVRLSEENAETIWIAPPYENAYMIQIAAAVLEAHEAGLTQPEIVAALQVGEHRGNARKTLYQASQLMTPVFTAKTPTTDEEPPTVPKATPSVPRTDVIFNSVDHRCQRGLRARLRDQSIPVRHRSTTR
jgi:hypothetical protein